MSDNNKSYRIKANVHEDTVLNVNLNQDFNILEVLSLKIGTKELYKFHTSKYGCVAGRVLANEGFGIPNAKISIFISAETEDLEDDIISYLYPYTSTSTKNDDKIRYNLLPEDQLTNCHRNVGSFPSKRMVLDDNNILEIFDKYYKFTTRTNNAGDYIIFGVPTGNQTIHVDIDLSDIGMLSQKPRDMVYKGYNITQFENANMFKKSTDLDNLAQIITQNQNVYVYPFWGEESEGEIAISRKDIDIQYQFTPTCVFMGSLITDELSNGISKRCIPSEKMGKMDNLTTGNGTIEMIRKKPDGTVEECIVQGNQLIDGNGVWCYQIPMNLDYVRTDEYGNIVPTDDITKGVPTRTSVRFRVSLTEFETEGEYSHLSKVLIPNNPQNMEEYDYAFGTKTTDDSFRDMFWNDVYTIKSYIPRLQMLNFDRNKKFSGIKAVNVNASNNPIPYNNMRVDLTFMFSLQCAIFKILLWIVGTINRLSSILAVNTFSNDRFLDNGGRCVFVGDGYCQNMEGWYFAPKCGEYWGNEKKGKEKQVTKLFNNTLNYLMNRGSGNNSENEVYDTESVDYRNRNLEEKKCLTANIKYFVQCVELTFAMEYDVVQFDFYNDWINGMIYMPRWFADVRPKRTYLFGAIPVKAKINACMENAKFWFQRRYVQQCALSYDISDYNMGKVTTVRGCKDEKSQRCHKSYGRKFKKLFKRGGLVHNEKTSTGEYAYYFKPCEWVNNGIEDVKCNLFATDIVLLGSLDSNNSQGIPQTFKKLVATSYQMPDPLASTNLGVEGYVYMEKDNRTLCSESDQYDSDGDYNKISIEKQKPTLKNVSDWSTYQLNNEDKILYNNGDLYDEKEYAITEASGIDWGYVGPNQNVEGANDIKKGLYFPGGHFLGISCGESETNIKSCVNLSRICELGTLMSQRQSVVKRTRDGGYTYSYLVPTGLISGDEINDYGFKNEFATLNYNMLKTKINPNTNLVEYDFETVNPINFNGELNGRSEINGAGYNDLKGFYDNEDRKIGKAVDNEDYDSWAYRRTIEENSADYYKFRFNLHEGDNRSSKYLEVVGNNASLPMYENSFYFYFGLRNGNTALDNFYKNFFAECPDIKEYIPGVSVTSHDRGYCETNGGTITIKVENVERPRVRIPSMGISEFIDVAEITYLGFTDGEYDVYVGGDNVDDEYYKKVTIGVEMPEIFQHLEFVTTNYTSEVDILDMESEDCGTAKFTSDIFSDTGVCALVLYAELNNGKQKCAIPIYNNGGAVNVHDIIEGTDGKYSAITSYSVSSESETGEIKLWAGNQHYSIEIYYTCDGHNVISETIRTSYVSMDWDPIIYFNNNMTFADYRDLVSPMLKVATNEEERRHVLNNWYDILLRVADNDPDTGATADKYYRATEEYFKKTHGDTYKDAIRQAKTNLKGAFFYVKPRSMFDKAEGKIVVGTHCDTPYTTTIIGSGEKIIGNVLHIDNSGNEEYDISVNNFKSPTQDAPNSTSYYLYDYNITGDTKGDYGIRVTDTRKSIPSDMEVLRMPSIYRPFFFRMLYIINNTTRSEVYQIAVANGISSEEPDGPKGIFCNESRVGKINLIYQAGDKDYSGRIPECSPKNFESHYKTGYQAGAMTMRTNSIYGADAMDWFGNKISKMETVTFIGDEVEGNRSIYRTYDRRVKYYYVPEGEITLMALSGASIVNENMKIQYNESYWGEQVLTGAITPIWNDALSTYIRSKYTEIKEDKIWQRYVDNIPDDNVVVGIYDSNIEYTGYCPIYDENITITSNSVEPRHENSISIIRLYNSHEFKTLILLD